MHAAWQVLANKYCLACCQTAVLHMFALAIPSHNSTFFCSDPNLHFVEQVALAPPEVQIDQQQQAEYEKQLHDAAAMPLPDADDDDIAE